MDWQIINTTSYQVDWQLCLIKKEELLGSLFSNGITWMFFKKVTWRVASLITNQVGKSIWQTQSVNPVGKPSRQIQSTLAEYPSQVAIHVACGGCYGVNERNHQLSDSFFDTNNTAPEGICIPQSFYPPTHLFHLCDCSTIDSIGFSCMLLCNFTNVDEISLLGGRQRERKKEREAYSKVSVCEREKPTVRVRKKRERITHWDVQ